MKTLICSLALVLGGHLFAGTTYFWYSLTNGAWSKFSDPADG